MKRIFMLVCMIALLALQHFSVRAQRITVTIAGNGFSGYSGDGGPAKLAQIGTPQYLCSDAQGNVYFADGTAKVRQVSVHTGIISLVAGGGSATGSGIPATSASISATYMCCDPAGNLYMVSAGNTIKMINPLTGIITNYAGTGASGYSGDGGPATAASFHGITGIASDMAGNIYVTDGSNNRIREITASTGIINTIAGTGTAGYTGDGGPASAAELSTPEYIGFNSSGDLFFVDQSLEFIRKIAASTGVISTYAGGGFDINNCTAMNTDLSSPTGFCIDHADNCVFNEISCSCRELNHINDSTQFIGGNYDMESFKDDTNSLYAWMHNNYSVASDAAGNLYIADDGNGRIRKLISLTHKPQFAFGLGQTVLACPGYAADLRPTLSVADLDAGQTETWSVLVPPANGTLSGFPATAVSAGVATTAKPAVATYLAPSTFTGDDSFVIKVSDGSLSDTITVYMKVSMPSIGSVTGGTSLCVDASGTYSCTSTYAGTWSTSNPSLTINAASGHATGVSDGVDTIIYQSNVSCPLTSTMIVTVNPLPDAGTIAGADTICVGATVTFSESVPGGVWSISPTAYVSVNPATGVATAHSYYSGILTIKYMVTNTYGCSSIAPFPITLNTPETTIAGVTPICTGITTTFSESIGGGSWNSSNGAASILADGTNLAIVSGVTPGVDTITYSNTNTCGTGTATRIITVQAPPATGTITGSSEVCLGGSTTFSSTVTGGRWSSYNSNASVGIVNGVVVGHYFGSDSIIYKVTASSACFSTVSTAINIDSTATAGTIAGATALCAETVTTFTNTISGGVWSVTNGTAAISGSGLLSGISPGIDTILYTFTGSCGTATTSYVVNIETAPDAGVIVSAASTVCLDSTISMYDAAGGGFWSSYNTHASVSAGNVTGNTVGIDTIVYIVTNSCGSALASQSIDVVNCVPTSVKTPNARAIYIFPNPAMDAITIGNNSNNGYFKYLIFNSVGQSVMSGSLLPYETVVSIVGLAPGLYHIMLTGDQSPQVLKLIKL